MRLMFFTINLCKLGLWLTAIPVVVHYYGILWGTLIIVLGALIWNWYQTIAGNYFLGQDPWRIFRAMLKVHWYYPLIAYGNNCGPKWGDDNPDTKGLKPIDGTDLAALDHDIDMEFAKTLSNLEARRKAKNTGDWLFIGRIWTHYSRTHGFYVPGASLGFLFRILGRSIL